jgi:alpha/beta superfamily hydrolase
MKAAPGSAVAIESGAVKLEALLNLPAATPPFPGIVVCHPHPQYGGDMHNGVVGAIVDAALSVGVAALRFNFRGVGASDGTYEGGPGEVQDVGAALTTLSATPEIDPARIALAGYSFGAVMALHHAAADPRPAAVIAVSPPTAIAARPATPLQSPLLVVTGDRDEYCDVAALNEQRTELASDFQIDVVPGADHFWWNSFDRLSAIVAAYLSRRFGASPEAP